jgi:peptidyl-dipeptidase Dcp
MNRRTFLRSAATSAVLMNLPTHLSLAQGEPAPLTNPLLAPFSGPYGGVPPFDRITVATFKPAILQAMDLQRAEIAALVRNPEPATFENTLAVLENSGRAYRRAVNMMWTYTGTMNDKAMQEVEKEMAPQLAAFDDEIVQNEALFARIKAVWEARGKGRLTPEQGRLLEVVHLSFTRNGAALGAADKARLKEINGRLASLYTAFGQNQLADEESQTVVLESKEHLAGLPETQIAGAAASAEAKGQKGRWIIANTRSAVEPFLVYSTRRDLREKVWRMFVSRGDSPGEHDNKPVIGEILALRAERAKLLGFPTYAQWKLDYSMARKPDAALALMMKVWPVAVARAREEIADMQAVADAEKAGHKIAPWDYRHYAEKVRKAKYEIDENEVKGYLQLEKMCEAMFWVAGQLFDLKFEQVRGVPVYHPDVQVFQVTRGGERVGLFYLDPYARHGKRSGAWMSEYRTQESFQEEITPIVSNNSNYVKSQPGEPVLISWGDAETLFHEFGHALHGLLSQISYPTLAGANTLGDFIEFPSQLLEHWLATPEVLNRFAIHYRTGKPIPAALIAKIQAAENFNQGFSTVEYLLSAIYDMKIHLQPIGTKVDPVAFEKATIEELNAPAEITLRHRPPHFGHIFAGDSYAAGYYNYLWADALTADAAEAFSEGSRFYDKALANKLETTIFSVGNSVPPDEAFRNFRGRDVDTNALMRDRGFLEHR